MKCYTTCLLTLIICTALAFSTAHAVTGEDRVSAVIVLQDADVASLKQTGYLKMAIPPMMVNRVDSVTLKRPVRFKDEPAILFNDVDRRQAMVSVRVDDATIDQIDYQPVELRIYESGFSSILVEYRPGNRTKSKKVSRKDSGVLVTKLKNGKSLTGRLANMKEFMIRSALGKIDVVLEDVSQITFEKRGWATVVMANGDRVSGKIGFRNVTINSRWGSEDLRVSDVASITKPITDAVHFPRAVTTPRSGMTASSVSVGPNYATGHNPMPMAVPAMPVPNSAWATPFYPAEPVYSYPNHQQIDATAQMGGQVINYSYDAYGNQQIFEQAVEQLMQPGEMMPMDHSMGPFFGEPTLMDSPMPIGEPPVGSFGEILQNPMGMPFGNSEAAASQDDFWFFPQ